MKNIINIKREFWHDVTTTPHFRTQVIYENCLIEHDDIYFDNLDQIIADLDFFDITRKNTFIIDGGQRFKITIIPEKHGGLHLQCDSEKTNLPGKISLEGIFTINGENVSEFILNFKALIREGKELNIITD